MRRRPRGDRPETPEESLARLNASSAGSAASAGSAGAAASAQPAPEAPPGSTPPVATPAPAGIQGRQLTGVATRVVPALIFVAVVAFSLGRPVLQELRLDASSRTAPASVVARDAGGRGGVQVEVEYPVDGTTQAAWVSWGSGSPLSVGDQTVVEYAPGDPTVVRIAGNHSWTTLLVAAVFAFVGVSAVVRAVRRRAR